MSEIMRRRRQMDPRAMMPPQGPGQPTMAGAGQPGMPMMQGTRGGDLPDEQPVPLNAGTMDVPKTPQQDPMIPAESAVRTAEEEAAYNMGARMGAESIAKAGMPRPQQPGGVNEQRLIEAEHLLMEYKKGKTSIDRRIINAQQWWKIRNWEQIENERGTRGATEIKSATAWLWNCICGKHAEAMDSFPEPVILPRMEEDKAEARILSDIVPVILKNNGFEQVYSQAQWQKFQEGTGAYYVGWDKTKMGGLGDISIRNVSLLNMFWEPGVEDIQESENLFFVNIVNTKTLEQQFPQLIGKLKNAFLQPKEYRKDDSVSTDGKSVLVDWYYHKWEGPRKVLHYCQFVNHEILYSTENNGEVEGLYNDGEYPFILDPLFPVHGSPAGYGLIDVAKDAQTDIDTLNQAMVQNAVVTSTPRYFIMSDGAINEDEFADWSKPFVHTNGTLGEQSLRQVETAGIQGSALQMLENKIEELKFITGNSDVQNGNTPSGVTAASAIAALQEAHGRNAKDASRGAYRAFNQISTMVIERLRQFYDIPRQFRILGPNGQQLFITYSNAKLQEQQIMGGMGLEQGLRKPVFDIDVRSERETAYTKMSQNELAIQFFQMGAFLPQNADQIMLMFDMMDFRGKDELVQKVQQNGTMQQALIQIGQIALGMAQQYNDPAAAQMIAQQLGTVIGGETIAAGAAGAGNQAEASTDAMTKAPEDKSGIVKNARARAQEATRPD